MSCCLCRCVLIKLFSLKCKLSVSLWWWDTLSWQIFTFSFYIWQLKCKWKVGIFRERERTTLIIFSTVLSVSIPLEDTIPGRQCMASCFFLLRQFEDVLIYLNSVKVTCIPITFFIQDVAVCYTIKAYQHLCFFFFFKELLLQWRHIQLQLCSS